MQKAASGCGYTVLPKAIHNRTSHDRTTGPEGSIADSNIASQVQTDMHSKAWSYSAFPADSLIRSQTYLISLFIISIFSIIPATTLQGSRQGCTSVKHHTASIAGESWQNIGYISLWTRLANKVVSPWLRSYLRNSVRLRWHTVTCIPRTARWHKVRHLYAATLEDGSHVSVLPQVATTPALWKPSPTLSDNFLKSVDWHTSQQCTYVCTHVCKVSAMHVLHQVRLLLLTDS